VNVKVTDLAVATLTFNQTIAPTSDFTNTFRFLLVRFGDQEYDRRRFLPGASEVERRKKYEENKDVRIIEY
jgi:hypothetical protein